MKKRFTALFLALALCLGLAVPAFAADDTAAQAIAAYQKVMSSPPSIASRYMNYQYTGGFYFDFDQNGVPELVLVYKDPGSSDWAMLVYYYNGTAQRITKGYPDVYSKSYSDDMLITSWGGSGGTGGEIVRFSNGTYGLQHNAYGFDTTTLTAKFSGNALVPTDENGTRVYYLGSDPLPSLNKFYTPSTTPTQPTGGSADFGLINNGTVMVDYYGPGGRVTVPSTVTEIRQSETTIAYLPITHLILPEGVTTIGDAAFMDMTGLTQVSLPSSLRTIGDWAFKNTGLTSVTIPAGVTLIDECTFLDCYKLASVSLPSGLKKISDWAFKGTALTSVTIPASVTYIGDRAFAYEYNIREKDVMMKAVIENGNATIHKNAFAFIKDAEVNGNRLVTIYSQPGGAVERYCKANGIPFQPLGSGTSSQFTDVAAGTWYAPPVDWAVSKGITNGTEKGKFSPTQNCTHAQILTFLYRANRGGGAADPADMDKAVAWAREKGMIGSGFNGGKLCTRADAVNYIWQAFGRQSAKASSFTDVPANASYARAVDWAVANGVTNGTNTAQTEFSPSKVCDRGTIVTFLHRAYVPEARLK